MLKLIHIPYGNEHPYTPEPFERFPRNPVEGEKVKIGVCVYSSELPKKVWVTWKKNDEPEHTSEGSEKHRDDKGSCYRAELPSFKRGDTVAYQIHALSPAGRTDSEIFSFAVSGWIERGDIEGYDLDDGYLRLKCASDAGREYLLFGLCGEDSLVSRTFFTGPEGDIGQPGRFNRRITFSGIIEHDDRIVFKGDPFRVTVYRSPCLILIEDAAGKVVLKEDRPARRLTGGTTLEAVSQTFVCRDGEGFFGFGERFNGLNQRGGKVDIRVFEQWRNQGDKTYMPVPFFLSSAGYGMYLNTNRYVEFDFRPAETGRWSYTAGTGSGGELEVYIFTGGPSKILNTFTGLTGKPALPPDWVFSPWMSSNEWNSRLRVMKEVAKTRAHDIPAGVLVIEAWSDEKNFYIWNDACYEPKPSHSPLKLSDFTFPEDGRWPDPKGMIDYLHNLGIKVILWQIPVLKYLAEKDRQHALDEEWMIRKKYCISGKDDNPYRVRPWWFNGGLVLDFTNPEAAEWWLLKRAYLLEEMGVDGFKTDGGEHLWGNDLHSSDSRGGDELLNLFPNLYEEAYSRFVKDRTKGGGIIFSRSGYTGAGRYSVHWTGDQESSWEELRSVLSGMLSAGLSGIPFIGFDLGGFSGEIPTSELYIRSAQMAAFCPVMQYHSEFNNHREPCIDRTPWNIAERTKSPEVISIYRMYAKLRVKLIPYIRAEAACCTETGAPLAAPLFFYWPEDRRTWEITDQYCFGRALLIAPVVYPGETEREVYLPAGLWLDFWTGEKIEGGRKLSAAAPLKRIPIYRREGALWRPIEVEE
ncbi:MAG: TIM-barrel domain-containing protein [Spirochaetota bacterium]